MVLSLTQSHGINFFLSFPPIQSSSNQKTMATNITYHPGNVTYSERCESLGSKGATIWLTGLSASGKSTIATALEQHLLHLHRPAFRLDGDNIRFGLNKDLGFSPKDREENIRRIAEVSFLLLFFGTVLWWRTGRMNTEV